MPVEPLDSHLLVLPRTVYEHTAQHDHALRHNHVDKDRAHQAKPSLVGRFAAEMDVNRMAVDIHSQNGRLKFFKLLHHY